MIAISLLSVRPPPAITERILQLPLPTFFLSLSPIDVQSFFRQDVSPKGRHCARSFRPIPRHATGITRPLTKDPTIPGTPQPSTQANSSLYSKQVFHQTPLSFALVNLKPILPGHVLVSPRRVVPRVADLSVAETSDLFLTVRRVGRMVERVYGAASLNIAVQDGVHAGQSVPHVHAHIIPRQRADLDHRGGTDAVYDLLDGEEGDVGKAFREAGTGTGTASRDGDGRADGTVDGTGQAENKTERARTRSRFPAVDDKKRKPRGEEEMRAEAEMLAREMEKEPLD